MSDTPMPSRGSLVLECVRVMEQRISTGEWKRLMPGERRLADLMLVGRDTVRVALQHLERSGMISAADSGSRRRILTAPTGKEPRRSNSLKIGLLAHRTLESLPQPMLLEVDRIRAALGAKGGSLRIYSPAWFNQRSPIKRLEELVEEEQCSAWILLRSNAVVQQ